MDVTTIIAIPITALLAGSVTYWLARRQQRQELRQARVASPEAGLQSIESTMQVLQNGHATGTWPEPAIGLRVAQQMRDSIASGGPATLKLSNSVAFRESVVALSDTFWAAVRAVENEDEEEWRLAEEDYFRCDVVARHALEQLKDDNL